MKEEITPQMIEAVQAALKKADYDFETLTINIFGGDITPCSATQGLFPIILDMALEHLKRKASRSLLEWIEPESPLKNRNNDYSKEKGLHLLNKPLPLFDWDMVQ